MQEQAPSQHFVVRLKAQAQRLKAQQELAQNLQQLAIGAKSPDQGTIATTLVPDNGRPGWDYGDW